MAGYTREVARRVFAQEFRESDLTYKDGDDQYAPQYLLTPTGARVNRIFIIGTLVEKEDIGSDSEYWRGRVIDPTGSFMIYAGQYQPEAAQILAECETPAFVAIVGKPSTYTTGEGDVLTSVRPESIFVVDGQTRDLWVVDAAKNTLARLKELDGDSPDAVKTKEYYNPDVKHYYAMVSQALKSLKETL
ncbi:RPA family protein [Methanolobus halotolerans]|uniref:DNA-binding protein n=1 Tax=Methanolobus halotolerans TaxID=2052935 RepID=A0A4E0QS20_9EURY|nr:DNA-binding protein [Methanolobus halotolerans]TGC09648.1 DNA-binding protein [Methanolobus halotolerans]